MTKEDLEKLIKLHGNSIYQFCFHLTGCQDDADDLYQETLCRAYEIRKRINYLDDESLFEKERNYCIGIAIRLYRNLYRKKLRRKEESIDNELADYHTELASNFKVEEIVLKNQMLLQIRESIAALPFKQRVIIYLFYFADLSIKEISTLLRIPEGTVKSRLNSARKTLKTRLEEIEHE